MEGMNVREIHNKMKLEILGITVDPLSHSLERDEHGRLLRADVFDKAAQNIGLKSDKLMASSSSYSSLNELVQGKYIEIRGNLGDAQNPVRLVPTNKGVNEYWRMQQEPGYFPADFNTSYRNPPSTRTEAELKSEYRNILY